MIVSSDRGSGETRMSPFFRSSKGGVEELVARRGGCAALLGLCPSPRRWSGATPAGFGQPGGCGWERDAQVGRIGRAGIDEFVLRIRQVVLLVVVADVLDRALHLGGRA